MSPDALAINAEFISTILTHRATVYSRTGGTGPYNLAVKTGLACRIDEVQGRRQGPATSTERRQAAALRTLQYDATYAFPPSGVQVEVTAEVLSNGQTVASSYAGQRWNPIAGTTNPANMPGMGTIAAFVDLERAS